jgi:hypothetical protein
MGGFLSRDFIMIFLCSMEQKKSMLFILLLAPIHM